TLLVSPLLALMRDQIRAAQAIGIRAETINSTNRDAWEPIATAVQAGEVDILLISPERLNNAQFRRDVLPELAGSVGLLVVDEAHCISDWGHDFRPDYRRVRDVIAGLGDDVPVLATTATANARVTTDVAEQLGGEPLVLRGSLARESLRLSVAVMPERAQRLAWLAHHIPSLPGSGIVYCLTVGDAERVADWLRTRGIDAAAYTGQTEPTERERIEAALRANELKVVVATTALSMGYDKPDLAFVVHYQSPSSPIAYYQAVGRAGRAILTANVMLLAGDEDRAIWDYFDSTAFPPRALVESVLDIVERAGGPVSANTIQAEANIGAGRLDALLKVLDVEGAVARTAEGWERTGAPWHYDTDRLERVEAARAEEAAAMLAYQRTDECLMAFLRTQLDDVDIAPCGRCANCTDEPAPSDLPPALVADAITFLRGIDYVIEPRKRWPNGSPVVRGNIGKERQCAPGRALAERGDGGWAATVESLLAGRATADDDITDAIARVLKRWDWAARPTWITFVPSRNEARQAVLADVAERLGALGHLPVHDVIRRTRDGRPQHTLVNSAHQVANVLDAFTIEGPIPEGPVLLLDDRIASGWTFAVVGALLRDAGAEAVLPFALLSA
ncbi:MAG TPA: helicase-related protein, partial [Acidimicrobiia bacterium]|nr:helicase-related protein [Acidimicrobiia bacterium]